MVMKTVIMNSIMADVYIVSGMETLRNTSETEKSNNSILYLSVFKPSLIAKDLHFKLI